jgi:hypothetical protein
MTHRIVDQTSIEDFEGVMITKQDEFILLNTQFSRVRQIRTCLSIDIELPSKLILSKEIRKENFIN